VKSNSNKSVSSSDSGSTVVDSCAKSNFETLLQSSIRNGTYSCPNRDHYQLEEGKLRKKHYRDVLEMMQPFKDATCWCERNACRKSWEFNYPGQSQLDYVAPFAYRKGYGKVVDAPKMVECVNYTLTPVQESYLERSYPNRVFCTTGDAYHDHPISHISAGISARRVWAKVKHGTEEKPCVYVDLDGNPGANETVMRRFPGLKIITTCSAVSSKDFVRSAVTWGPQTDQQGNPRYYPVHIRDFGHLKTVYGVDLESVEGVVSFHSVYYYDRREISAVLQLCPEATFTAVLHRHCGDSGELYGGEHLWERVRETQEIVQTNTHTGEKYVHPCTEKWFNYTSCVVSQGHVAVVHESGSEANVGGQALAWTTNMLNPDTFILVIVACPVIVAKSDLGGEYYHGMELERERPTVVLTPCSEVARHSYWRVNTVSVPVPIGCTKMLEVLYSIPREADTPKVRRTFDLRCALKKKDPEFVKPDGSPRLSPSEFENLREIAYWLNYKERYELTSCVRTQHVSAIISSKERSVASSMMKAGVQGLANVVRNGGLRNAAAGMLDCVSGELGNI